MRKHALSGVVTDGAGAPPGRGLPGTSPVTACRWPLRTPARAARPPVEALTTPRCLASVPAPRPVTIRIDGPRRTLSRCEKIARPCQPCTSSAAGALRRPSQAFRVRIAVLGLTSLWRRSAPDRHRGMASPELEHDDLTAALGARRELGHEAEREVLESFLDRVGTAIDARVDQRLAEDDRFSHRRSRGQNRVSTPLALGSMAMGIAVTGAA